MQTIMKKLSDIQPYQKTQKSMMSDKSKMWPRASNNMALFSPL